MAVWSQTPSTALPKAPQAVAPPLTQPRVRIAGSAQRNENVAVHQIDNNAVKEANVRLGTRTTIVQFPLIESGYFAAEHGQPPSEALMLAPAAQNKEWHGEL